MLLFREKCKLTTLCRSGGKRRGAESTLVVQNAIGESMQSTVTPIALYLSNSNMFEHKEELKGSTEMQRKPLCSQHPFCSEVQRGNKVFKERQRRDEGSFPLWMCKDLSKRQTDSDHLTAFGLPAAHSVEADRAVNPQHSIEAVVRHSAPLLAAAASGVCCFGQKERG